MIKSIVLTFTLLLYADHLQAMSSSLVFTGYGSAAYSDQDYESYNRKLRHMGLNTADFLYTCYVNDEHDHKIDCDSVDSPKLSKIERLIKKASTSGLKTSLRVYVDLRNKKWRAYWRPKNVVQAFKNLEGLLVRSARFAKRLKVDSLIIGSEYEKLTEKKYTVNWLGIIKRLKRDFPGNLLYAANGNINKRSMAEYQWVGFWSELHGVGVNHYPPYRGKNTQKNLTAHHERNLKKYFVVANKFNKKLYITEVGFPLAASGVHTPFKWQYSKKESTGQDARNVSFSAFLGIAGKLGVKHIDLWRFLPGESKVHPRGYIIDQGFMETFKNQRLKTQSLKGHEK